MSRRLGSGSWRAFRSCPRRRSAWRTASCEDGASDGDFEAWRGYLAAAARAHGEAGRLLDQVICATALSYRLMYEGNRYGEARRALAALPDAADLPGYGGFL